MCIQYAVKKTAGGQECVVFVLVSSSYPCW